MKEYEFFMIYVEGESSPTFKHLSYESAVTEAKRLARAFKKKVYILHATKYFELNEFKEVNLIQEDPDVPF